jgi:predicted ATPase/class 3 adenylate cyclase
MSAPRAKHRLSAILSADAVGYSRLVSRDEMVATRRIGESRECIAALVSGHDGRVVDAVGDNLLAEFGSVADAVGCAVAIQADLGARNAAAPRDERLPFRIGVEIGDVLVDGNRIAGESVNVAARLESLAPVGGLAISGAVRDQLAGRIDLELQDLGERRLHNIPRPVQVFRVDLGGGAAADGAIEGNLPTPRTSFVGRARARAELLGLLASERLVTLTGLGGAGKTRLALEVAHDTAASFDGGAWWVELQALSDADQVAAAVAKAVAGSGAPLGLGGGAGAEEQIARAIGQRRTLVVLDNCEHLAEVCAALADALLSRCTMLTILATSREPLEVSGERVWQLATLEVPREEIALADAPECVAIALFLDRARSARADFALSEADLRSVQKICIRLDGIPLAIELAAVRVRHLSPEEIARRLDDRFKLLVAGRRRSERRHQTLQAALDWSYDLLDEPSRALFRRLSVFPSRFSLAAVEGVCGEVPVQADDVLELLGSLVDRSFVTLDESVGELRYRLLETVREYASQKLDEAGERSITRARHVEWFAIASSSVAEQLVAESRMLSLWGGDAIASESEWLDDFNAATEWALREGPAPPPMLPIATVALLRVAGRTAEAIALSDRVDLDAFDARERAFLTMGLASAYTHQGDFRRAYDVLDTVVGFARAAELSGLAVSALGNQLVASLVSGKETAPLARQLMDAAEALDRPDFSSFAEGMVGSLDLIEGRFGEASRHLSRSTRLDPTRTTLAHGYAIVAALLAGDEDAAEAAARHSMGIAPPVAAIACANFGWNPLRSLALWHAWTGDLDEARRVESRALAYQHAKPMPLADADHLVTLAAIAYFEDDPEHTALLLGVGRRAMADFRSWRGHDAGPLYLHFRQRCAEALGREHAERLRGQGLARDPYEVLAEARAELASG